MISTVLLAVDGSGHARRAVDYGIDIATRYRAKLAVLTVHPPGPLPRALQDFVEEEDLGLGEVYERIVADVAKEAEQRGVETVAALVEEGDPAATILAAADRQGADLIVMGGRGMSDLAGLVIGSVSHKVLHLAKRPCLIVP